MMVEQEKQQKVSVYIRALRNSVKKEYAEKYLLSVLEKRESPDRGALSVMAAQAVRMTIDEILED